MYRKRASPAPFFRQPAAYNPITGKHAPIGASGILSRVAMMQIIGDDGTEANADTHENYVICRGYDPETRRFYNSLKVGKPYGLRGTYPYQLAEVHAAIKAISTSFALSGSFRPVLGDTPGVAHTTIGHPADLDESIAILKDDDKHPIAWLLLDVGSGQMWRWGVLDGNLNANSYATTSLWWDGTSDWRVPTQDSGEDWEECYAPFVMSSGTIVAGKRVGVCNFGTRKIVMLHEC